MLYTCQGDCGSLVNPEDTVHRARIISRPGRPRAPTNGLSKLLSLKILVSSHFGIHSFIHFQQEIYSGQSQSEPEPNWV